MKHKIFFLLLAIVSICHNGCKSKKSNKIILNFSMGMNLDKLNEVADSLANVKKIEFEADQSYFTYKFILSDGITANTRCTPTMSDGFLCNLKIEFGHIYGSKNFQGIYQEQFSRTVSMDAIEKVFQQYVDKYGIPETKKGSFTGYYQYQYKEYDAFYWKEDDYDIVFFKGEGLNDVYGVVSHGGIIEYTLNESAKEKLRRQKSVENNDL